MYMQGEALAEFIASLSARLVCKELILLKKSTNPRTYS